MRIAYLVNTYPRPSHTFIRREVQALERRGISVHRFAMRSDYENLVDPADLAEDARTEHILQQGAFRLATSLLCRALRHPLRMLRAVGLAMQAGRRGGGTPGSGGLLRHLAYLAEAAHIARRCQSLRIVHLHAHFGTNPATVAMLAHSLGGPPYSFTVHGPEEFDAPRALSLTAKMQRAAFTVAISSFGRSQLYRWANAADWPRLHVVHCGIEPGKFRIPTQPPKGGPHLVAIGRLAEQKGFSLLIDALSLARKVAPGLHLTLVGDGPMRLQIESLIAENRLGPCITLTGWQDEAGVAAALAQAQALVLPSFAEGLPMVVMEAMAAGRPVIATAIAGVPELVVPGETGWIVPAGDPLALAEAVVALAKTPHGDLITMGQAARSRVLERHDIDVAAAKLAGLLAGRRIRGL